MTEYLVILTMKRAMTEATVRRVFAVRPGDTRDDLFGWALDQMTEEFRNPGLRQGTVLFFSAEPLHLDGAI